MATRPLTKAQVGAARLYTWETLTETNDDGAPVDLGDNPRSATGQLTGDFGSGNTGWQGSNDGTNYFTLLDVGGNTSVISAAGGAQFATLPRYIRPLVATGSAVDVDASLLVRDAD